MWISTEIDELKPITYREYTSATYAVSDRYPVMVEGHKYWQRGYYIEYEDGDGEWKVEGWHGAFNVTHWYDLPEFPR